MYVGGIPFFSRVGLKEVWSVRSVWYADIFRVSSCVLGKVWSARSVRSAEMLSEGLVVHLVLYSLRKVCSMCL